MKFIETKLAGVVVIEPKIFADDRGWFMESFNEPLFHEQLAALGHPIPRPFVQDNHSCSKKHVLRGLHFQRAPHAQGKLVRVTAGSAYDVAVDIRKGSETFGQWVGVELSAKNGRMLWIPEGFAHGFLALEDNTEFLYKTTDIYSTACEASINWSDPSIAIQWPITEGLIVSQKDSEAPLLSNVMSSISALTGDVTSHELAIIGDDRGSLIALEQGRDIPFDVRRAYYIFNTKAGVSRGSHAHYRLEQYIICLSGKCRILLDDGLEQESIWLDAPNKAIHIKNLIWREMHDFSEDCVLLVFASNHYDERDYLRNYDDFIRAAKRYA
jgi:dTDP-4-dehydrorhamnose 3,5-epimerase